MITHRATIANTQMIKHTPKGELKNVRILTAFIQALGSKNK